MGVGNASSSMLGFLQGFGMWEWLIILAIVLILFGSSRIPALARGLGKSIKEFKGGLQEGEVDSVPDNDKKTQAGTTDKNRQVN